MSQVIEIDEASFAAVMGAESLAKLHHELRWGNYARAVQAEFNQRALAKDLQEASPIEELGQLNMQVDAFAFHWWGQQLGYECWDDDEFLREFYRDNPECRVKYKPRTASIIVPGMHEPRPDVQLIA